MGQERAQASPDIIVRAPASIYAWKKLSLWLPSLRVDLLSLATERVQTKPMHMVWETGLCVNWTQGISWKHLLLSWHLDSSLNDSPWCFSDFRSLCSTGFVGAEFLIAALQTIPIDCCPSKVSLSSAQRLSVSLSSASHMLYWLWVQESLQFTAPPHSHESSFLAEGPHLVLNFVTLPLLGTLISESEIFCDKTVSTYLSIRLGQR